MMTLTPFSSIPPQAPLRQPTHAHFSGSNKQASLEDRFPGVASLKLEYPNVFNVIELIANTLKQQNVERYTCIGSDIIRAGYDPLTNKINPKEVIDTLVALKNSGQAFSGLALIERTGCLLPIPFLQWSVPHELNSGYWTEQYAKMIQDMDKVTDNREKRVIASHFLERMVIVLDDTTVEALKAHRKR